MVEFFDVFRSIKTARISPKASVYPGTTQYGPRFHVGQDAEPILIWQDVEQPEYLEFMADLVKDRFGGKINIEVDVNQLLIYSSFGIPRAYINLVRAYGESKKKSKQSKFNEVIENRCKYLSDEYRSIIDKLPQYGIYINIGWQLFSAFVSELKELNHLKIRQDGDEFRKTVTVGIDDINDEKVERLISFLVEAGLVYEINSISHGVDRKIRRFIPHYAYLIKERVFSIGKGFNAIGLAKLISMPSEKHPLRKKLTKLLPPDVIESIALTLPSCSNCGARRLSDNQKYCHMCGNRLVDESSFRSCMRKSLLELPLSDFQKRVISQTKFKTVEDVISSKSTATELMKVKLVAQKRASVIEQKVRSWINEFLE